VGHLITLERHILDGILQQMINMNWPIIKAKLREDIIALPQFLKNPIQGMRNLPHWEWPTILILQGAYAAICSVIANFIERDYFGVVTGIVVAPVANFILAALATSFFHYFFLYFLKRQISFRAIYLHVIFAAIPLMFTTMVAFLVPPLVLVGMLASLMLLYVGFVDTFQMPKKPVRNALAVIFLLMVGGWTYQLLQSPHKHKHTHEGATPETLDILEKELKESSDH
jgi:hypothetical protein